MYRVGQDDYRIYGCLYRTNRRRLVTSFFSCNCSVADQPQPGLWLAGRQVAFNSWGCAPPGLGGCYGRAGTIDLRDGDASGQLDTGGYVDDLALKPNGSFALIAGGQVRKLDSGGEGVLDPGPGVLDGSLALSGSLLYRTRDDQPHSAVLR